MVESGLLQTKMVAIYFSFEAGDIQACFVLNCSMEFLNQFCVSNLIKEVIQFFLNKFVSSGLSMTVSSLTVCALKCHNYIPNVS